MSRHTSELVVETDLTDSDYWSRPEEPRPQLMSPSCSSNDVRSATIRDCVTADQFGVCDSPLSSRLSSRTNDQLLRVAIFYGRPSVPPSASPPPQSRVRRRSRRTRARRRNSDPGPGPLLSSRLRRSLPLR